jgi:hypothetical protein
MRQGTGGFITVFQIHPDMFRQVVAIFLGGRRYLISYSGNGFVVGVYGLRSIQCGHLSFNDNSVQLSKYICLVCSRWKKINFCKYVRRAKI